MESKQTNRFIAMLWRHCVLFAVVIAGATCIVYLNNSQIYNELNLLHDSTDWVVPHGQAFYQLLDLQIAFLAAWFVAIPIYLAAFCVFCLKRVKKNILLWVSALIVLTTVAVYFGSWVLALLFVSIAAMHAMLGTELLLRQRSYIGLLLSMIGLIAIVMTMSTQNHAYQFRNFVLSLPVVGTPIINAYYQFNYYAIPAVGHLDTAHYYAFDSTVSPTKRAMVSESLAMNGWYEKTELADSAATLTYDKADHWLVQGMGYKMLAPSKHLPYHLYQANQRNQDRPTASAALIFKLILIFALGTLLFLIIRALMWAGASKFIGASVVGVVLVLMIFQLSRFNQLESEADTQVVDCDDVDQVPDGELNQLAWLEKIVVEQCILSGKQQAWWNTHQNILIRKRALDLYAEQGNIGALRAAFHSSEYWYIQHRARQLIARTTY